MSKYLISCDLESLKLYSEVTHELCFPYDLHSSCDLMTTVIYVLERCRNHVHVVICVNTTSNAETEKVKTSETVLAGYRIAVCKNISDLTSTYTSLDVKLDGQSLCRELFLRNLIEHLVCIYENRVTANRTLIRDSVFIQLGSEVLYVTDTCLDGLKLSILIKTYCKWSHVTTVHTTICKEALKRNTESLCTLVPVLMTGCDKTTHVYKTVLL